MIAVGSEYFETIGAELVAGRFFSPDDKIGAARVVVVNETYARVNLKGQPAIGRTFGRQDRDPRTIIGVVKDVSPGATDGPRLPVVYTPIAQTAPSRFSS